VPHDAVKSRTMAASFKMTSNSELAELNSKNGGRLTAAVKLLGSYNKSKRTQDMQTLLTSAVSKVENN